MLAKEQSKSWKNRLLNNLLYGGIKKEEYRELEEEILERDRNSLAMISICLMLMFQCLFIGSLFFGNDGTKQSTVRRDLSGFHGNSCSLQSDEGKGKKNCPPSLVCGNDHDVCLRHYLKYCSSN